MNIVNVSESRLLDIRSRVHKLDNTMGKIGDQRFRGMLRKIRIDLDAVIREFHEHSLARTEMKKSRRKKKAANTDQNPTSDAGVIHSVICEDSTEEI